MNIAKLLEGTLLTECAEDVYQDGTSVESTLKRFRGWGLEQQVIEHQKKYHLSDGLPADHLASDDFLWWVSVYTIFYAGMRFETVQKKLPRMHERLGDHRVVMRYGERNIESLCSDPGLIKYRAKMKSCISNAKIFAGVVESCGSFSAFLGRHVSISMESESAYLESVSAAVNVLRGNFRHFGDVVALHYLTDTCYPVVKPDTHVCRVLYRLGLIDVMNPVGRQVHRVSLAAVKSGAQAEFAPRYTDIVLMRFGYHVCRLELPRCSICSANGVCKKRGVANHE